MRFGADGTLQLSPTDLNGFLACEHLTTLQLAVARGELRKPFRHNPHAELIRRKGDEHEAAYLARLAADGRDVAEVRFDDRDWERAARETEQAIQMGADVVYQAALTDGRWRGFADFIERRLDGDGYEVVDTKLARRAKPQHVLQLCFYTEQLARIQGSWPTEMQVVTGIGERESFRPGDFLAYYRRLRVRFLDAVERRRPTYPYPVDFCTLCDFLALCKARWAEDDHLTLVAGMSRIQVERLQAAGITTLQALAEADPTTKVRSMRATTFEGLHLQAELQLHHRRTGEHRIEHLPEEPDPRRRLARPRGRPVVRAGARARVPDRLDRAGRGRRAALRAHLGARPRRRETSLRAARRPPRRAPPPLPGHTRLPLRAVRAHRALAAHGRARHARGRDRRPAPR